MDSCGKPSEESTTAEVKKNMIVYCMNAMRKRTIDELLLDLSAITKSSLSLEIVYDKTGFRVTYSVGPLNASVNGPDESKCVWQCKYDVLHKLFVFCKYTKRVDETASILQARHYRNSSLSSMLDAYSEIKLCKDRGCAKPETEIPKELSDFMHYNRSPIILKVKYMPTEWEMIYETGPYTVSAKGSLKSTCMHQCKTKLMHMLRACVIDARVSTGKNVVDRKAVSEITQAVAQEESIGKNQQRELSNKTISPAVVAASVVARLPESNNRTAVSTKSSGTRWHSDKPRQSFNTPEAYEKFVDRATEVLRTITWHMFRGSAKRFFDILAQANHANRSYVKKITDCLVLNAIENPENCAIYAELCRDAMEKSWRDSRVAVREGLSCSFRMELIQSCRDVLTQAGVVLRVETARRPQTGRRNERFDASARDRTQGTCRLMGELFILDEIFKTVVGIVNTLIQAHDAHSLECLCVLLATIGPKIKRITDNPRQVYERLERYSVAGHAGNTPLPRRTVHMIEHVLNMWKSSTKTLPEIRGVPAKRKNPEGDGRRLQLQPEDRSANRTPGPSILRSGRNLPPVVAMPAHRHPKRVSFNTVVSILSYPRHKQ